MAKHKGLKDEVSFSVQEEATIAEVHNVLCDFVSSSPEAWAPIISKWSLQLLGKIYFLLLLYFKFKSVIHKTLLTGELSSRYAGRAIHSGVLNDSLQLWMSCRATRSLIDITTQCLSCLMNFDTESCINALLGTVCFFYGLFHSPH